MADVNLTTTEEVVQIITINSKGDPGTPVNHNDLLNIQGGTAAERYHLTAAQVDEIAANTAKVSFPEAPNDGKQYARESLGWSEVATGGGGGMWERVTTETVVGSAVQEILFNTDIGGGGLDFDTYEYLITGDIIALANANQFAFYSVEANAGVVNGGDYKGAYSWATTASVVRNSSPFNILTNVIPSTAGRIKMKGSLFYRSDEGRIIHDDVGGMTYLSNGGTVPTMQLSRMSWNNNSVAVSDKIGIYNTVDANFGVGSVLILWRRAK